MIILIIRYHKYWLTLVGYSKGRCKKKKRTLKLRKVKPAAPHNTGVAW